jgi:hypothetical protein
MALHTRALAFENELPNRRIASPTPTLADLTVSLLHEYGLAPPGELIGKDVLEPKK